MDALATYRMYASLSLSFMPHNSIGRRWLAHVCVSASFAQALSSYFGPDPMDQNEPDVVRQTDIQAKFSLLLPSANVSLLNVLHFGAYGLPLCPRISFEIQLQALRHYVPSLE